MNNNNYEQEQNMFDSMPESRQTHQIKNQFSTFIQQLQQTTQKLIDQVFNSQYTTQYQDQNQQDNYHSKINQKIASKTQYYKNNTNKIPITPQNYGHFTSFLLRSQKWVQTKEKNRIKEAEKKNRLIQSTITQVPKINRGSIQKLDPIWVRATNIQQQRQQKLAFKRIDKKKQEQQKINQILFHPKVNKKTQRQQPRSLQQYLKDKQEWMKNKNDKISKRKLLMQARKYQQCIFSPVLQTNRYNQRHLKLIQSQKVQERLLRSLQKSVQKFMPIK